MEDLFATAKKDLILQKTALVPILMNARKVLVNQKRLVPIPLAVMSASTKAVESTVLKVLWYLMMSALMLTSVKLKTEGAIKVVSTQTDHSNVLAKKVIFWIKKILKNVKISTSVKARKRKCARKRKDKFVKTNQVVLFVKLVVLGTTRFIKKKELQPDLINFYYPSKTYEKIIF